MDIGSISFPELAVSIIIWISHHASNDYLCPLKNSIALNILYMFNKRIKIKELLTREPSGQEVTVMGWVRTFRNNQFIALNDGSTNNNLQVVAALGKFDEELLKKNHHLGGIESDRQYSRLTWEGSKDGFECERYRDTWRQRCRKISLTTEKA